MRESCEVCGAFGDDPLRVLILFRDERYGTTYRTWQVLCASHRAGLTLLAEQTSLLAICPVAD